MPKALESFTIVRSGDGVVLQIEDEEGETQELSATATQLEAMADEIDRQILLLDEDQPDLADEED